MPDPNGTWRCEQVFDTFAEEDTWSPRTTAGLLQKYHKERPTDSWKLETILQCMDLDVFWLDRPEMQEQVIIIANNNF